MARLGVRNTTHSGTMPWTPDFATVVTKYDFRGPTSAAPKIIWFCDCRISFTGTGKMDKSDS